MLVLWTVLAKLITSQNVQSWLFATDRIKFQASNWIQTTCLMMTDLTKWMEAWNCYGSLWAIELI